jgi:hypothetical protein
MNLDQNGQKSQILLETEHYSIQKQISEVKKKNMEIEPIDD